MSDPREDMLEAVTTLRHELDALRAELAECHRDNVIYRACANGYAESALRALMQMTGSYNRENPWLGVTAAVALLQNARSPWITGWNALVTERDQLRERLALAERSRNEMDIMRVTINSQKEWIDGCHRELKARDEKLALAERALEDQAKRYQHIVEAARAFVQHHDKLRPLARRLLEWNSRLATLRLALERLDETTP